MRSYLSWLIEREIYVINHILSEAISDCAVPETKLKKEYTSDEIVSILKTTFAFEKGRQAGFGQRIRNPQMVIVNKLRHELIGYDNIRNKITACYNDGKISICEKLQLEMDLQQPLKKLIDDTIEIIHDSNFPLDLGWFKIESKDHLFDANQTYKDNEMNSLSRDYSRLDCKAKLAGRTPPAGPRPMGTPMSQRLPSGVRRLGGTGPMSPPPPGFRMDKD